MLDNKYNEQILVIGRGISKLPSKKLIGNFGIISYINCTVKHENSSRFKCCVNLNQANNHTFYLNNHGNNMLVYNPDLWINGKIKKLTIPDRLKNCTIIEGILPDTLLEIVKKYKVGWASSGLAAILYFLNCYPDKTIYTWGMSQFTKSGEVLKPITLQRAIDINKNKPEIHHMDVEYLIALHIQKTNRVFSIT